jgi:hypothetical protein
LSHNGPAEALTEASHVPRLKPIPTRSRNPTTTGGGGKGSASESTLKGTTSHSGASETLLHRLAGPSVGKAGLARDQTDITRVIARVSEGSKYYEVSGYPGISGVFSIPLARRQRAPL